MGVIRTKEDLRTFRRSWSGESMLDLLEKNGGRILVNWAIGVGKSFNLDNVLEAAIREDKYDLVIVLSSRTQLVEERRWVRDPPQDIRVVQLKPRPFLACGQERDRDWKILEKGRMGTLGRRLICNDACPRREECFWPIQYHSDHLEGTKVIYGTQALVTAIPELVPMLKRKTGAGSILVLLDEIHFLQKEFCRKIDRHALTPFVSTLQDLQRREPSGYNEEWIYSSELLLHARTEDLRFPDWRFSFLDPAWVLEVQKVGWALHRQRFRFLGYDLRQFGYSLLPSRERDSDGTIIFAAKPKIPCNFILYSAIADPQFVRFRLGIDLASPFSERPIQTRPDGMVQPGLQNRCQEELPEKSQANSRLLRLPYQTSLERGKASFVGLEAVLPGNMQGGHRGATTQYGTWSDPGDHRRF